MWWWILVYAHDYGFICFIEANQFVTVVAFVGLWSFFGETTELLHGSSVFAVDVDVDDDDVEPLLRYWLLLLRCWFDEDITNVDDGLCSKFCSQIKKKKLINWWMLKIKL